MHKTLHFLKLDLLTVKPYLTLKNGILLLVVFFVMGVTTGSVGMIISMFMLFSAIYVTYPFAVGDKNAIDILYATLPISRRHVVTGRYAFALCFNLLGGAAAFLLAVILLPLFQMEGSVRESLYTVLICLALYTVVQAVQLPIFFKLGYTKGKLFSYLPFLGFPAAVALARYLNGKELLSPLLITMAQFVTRNRAVLLLLALLLWVLIAVVSWRISCRFYLKREF